MPHSPKTNRSQRPAAPDNPEALLREESGPNTPGEGLLRAAVAYPNSYRTAMASLGFLHVRQMLQEAGPLRVERLLLDGWGPRCLESRDPLGRFDLIAFSVAYELDFLGVLRLLEAAGLPLFAAQRGPRHPIILAGGAALSINPHPLYPFIDAIANGDAELVVQTLVDHLVEAIPLSDPANRARALDRIDHIEGLRVTAGAWRAAGRDPRDRFITAADGTPSDDWPALETAIDDNSLDGDPRIEPPPSPPVRANAEMPVPAARLVTPHAEFGRRVLIEIARGCPHGCGFCWLGARGGDFRPLATDAILAAADRACAETDCDDLGLIASAVGAHPEIETLCDRLLSRGRRLAFSSLRADEASPFLLEALARSGQRGFTLAPETGREETRRRLGKPIADAVFFDVVERARRLGLREIKFYFMIGLPRETDEDTDAIVAFLKRAAALAGGRVNAGIGVYVPKPGAPLSRFPAPDIATVRRRLSRLMKSLGRLPGVRAAASSPDLAAAQALLANNGFAATALLREVLANGGEWRGPVRRLFRAQNTPVGNGADAKTRGRKGNSP